MKTFLALFTCAVNSKNHEAWKQLAPQVRQDRMEEGTRALEQWNEKYRNRIVFDGGSLGESTKIVDNTGIQDVPSRMGAFLVVQADSHDEAAAIFKEHPHFASFPGDGVEILERSNSKRS